MPENNKEVVRVRFFCDSEEQRDRLLMEIFEATKGAKSGEECIERLTDFGMSYSEEYYPRSRYDRRTFAAGYYPTLRYGEGKSGWQCVAYPAVLYLSVEEYEDARYGSFFYEIFEKVEERG